MDTAIMDAPRPRASDDPQLWSTAHNELRQLARDARAPRKRSLREFALEEIVIPPGSEYEGFRYRVERQPLSGLFLDAVADLRWCEFVCTGPAQTTKTLTTSTIPCVYHLFEHAETVVFALPDETMAYDKWSRDIEPVIRASRYADLIPPGGAGSRGGRHIDSIRFLNGAVLKFMSAAARDAGRAGYQTRVVCASEIDKFIAKMGAVESDPLRQLRARQRSRERKRRRSYFESTPTIPEGPVWQQWSQSSRSYITLECPHCRQWVQPDRALVEAIDAKADQSVFELITTFLTGWESAASERQVMAEATWRCPDCGAPWSDEQWRAANHAARLDHTRTDTDVFGFRWGACNNLFLPAADIALDVWKAQRAADQDEALKDLCQQVLAVPYRPPEIEAVRIEYDRVRTRLGQWGQGLLPPDTTTAVAHIDVQMRRLYYLVLATRARGTHHVVDYGAVATDADSVGVEPGILAALRDLRERFNRGYPMADAGDAPARTLDAVFVDAGYQKPTVMQFCAESGARWWPALGRGQSQMGPGAYTRPKSTGAVVRYIGEEYHIARVRDGYARADIVEINADYWKSRVQEKFTQEINSAGAIVLFKTTPQEHSTLAFHLTAERPHTQLDTKREKMVQVWKRLRYDNHHLDNLYNALAATHLVETRARPAEGDVITDWFAGMRRGGRKR